MSEEVTESVPRGPWCTKHNCTRDVENDCSRCHGDGEIEGDDYLDRRYEKCYQCDGSGVGYPDCEYCIEEDHDGF